MKLIRFGEAGKEKPGICMDGVNYDVSGFIKDYNEDFFANGGLSELGGIDLQEKGLLPKVAIGVRLGAPLARPSKIICIGLNYADHAKETGATPPTEPVIFMKATSAICGPFDDCLLYTSDAADDL